MALESVGPWIGLKDSKFISNNLVTRKKKYVPCHKDDTESPFWLRAISYVFLSSRTKRILICTECRSNCCYRHAFEGGLKAVKQNKIKKAIIFKQMG